MSGLLCRTTNLLVSKNARVEPYKATTRVERSRPADQHRRLPGPDAAYKVYSAHHWPLARRIAPSDGLALTSRMISHRQTRDTAGR